MRGNSVAPVLSCTASPLTPGVVAGVDVAAAGSQGAKGADGQQQRQADAAGRAAQDKEEGLRAVVEVAPSRWFSR